MPSEVRNAVVYNLLNALIVGLLRQAAALHYSTSIYA
jgi:hypothetical protein